MKMQINLESSHGAARLPCSCTEIRSLEPTFTNRERFLRACWSQPVDRPPVWLMRQAGRVLPEYRALKERHSFLELVQTPDLAAEVTLQPIRRFDFDAAIVFSDILVLPEALGQPYRFGPNGGVQMDFRLETAADIERLNPAELMDRLAYVTDAIRLVKSALNEQTALIGFSGSPWTLANFMLEGGSAKEHKRAKALFYSDRPLFNRFLQKLADSLVPFLQAQIDAGADAIQIFDSLGGILPANAFGAASAQWMSEIIARLDRPVPVIVFAKGTHGNWNVLIEMKPQVLGIDWTISMSETAAVLPDQIALQGNLDPQVLTTSPEVVRAEARALLREMHGRSGFIFNLGHGVPPMAPLENIETLVDTVRGVS